MSTRTERSGNSAFHKLVAGTEVLRTGGGATLSASECNAILDRLADLEDVARAAMTWAPGNAKITLAQRLGEVLDA